MSFSLTVRLTLKKLIPKKSEVVKLEPVTEPTIVRLSSKTCGLQQPSPATDTLWEWNQEAVRAVKRVVPRLRYSYKYQVHTFSAKYGEMAAQALEDLKRSRDDEH